MKTPLPNLATIQANHVEIGRAYTVGDNDSVERLMADATAKLRGVYKFRRDDDRDDDEAEPPELPAAPSKRKRRGEVAKCDNGSR